MLDDKLNIFIREHLNDDLYKLALSAGKYPDIDIKKALLLIQSKRKLSDKMEEWAIRDDLIFSFPTSIEQSSSKLTAQYKQKYCRSGLVFDLTGGIGMDAYHLSLNNRKVIYFERDVNLFNEVSHNFKTLGLNNITLINREITKSTIDEILSKVCNEEGCQADLIYIDPSRRKIGGKRILELKEYEPDITELKEKLFSYTNRIVVKVSPMTDLKRAFEEYGNVSAIDILSINNDCKEVVFILDKGCSLPFNSVDIETINYCSKKGVQKLRFTPQDEIMAKSQFSGIDRALYLYEPNRSILKSGAFKLTGERFSLDKVAINTHLYTGESLNIDFPGRVFKIKEVTDYNKHNIHNLSKKYPKVNVSVRNFPIPASALRKELGCEDGGETTLVGCTLNNGSQKMVICSQIF